jgi:hypothetical protein
MKKDMHQFTSNFENINERQSEVFTPFTLSLGILFGKICSNSSKTNWE